MANPIMRDKCGRAAGRVECMGSQFTVNSFQFSVFIPLNQGMRGPLRGLVLTSTPARPVLLCWLCRQIPRAKARFGMTDWGGVFGGTQAVKRLTLRAQRKARRGRGEPRQAKKRLVWGTPVS